jgi:hypothetical protein
MHGVEISSDASPRLRVGAPDSGDEVFGRFFCYCLQDNKIRFDMDLTAAQHANVRISSRLLVLARIVIGGGKQG